MPQPLPPFFSLSSEFARARQMGLPVVALESTVITHGLPYPENLKLAREMEAEVRSVGAIPATIAVVDGKVCVGINDAQLEMLSKGDTKLHKISSRDFGAAVSLGASGGTTVAGTLAAASAAGIHVFATGGIGGVHRGAPYDISADLVQLGRTPVIVVCAGAKAILDLPATLEVLETLGVPVIGYGTDEFPAFYSRSSGLKLNGFVNRPEEVARLARAHWDMGMDSAVLVTVPIPEDAALSKESMDRTIDQALEDAHRQGVTGQAVTPFLLARVSELTGGSSLRANLALLKNNAWVAAQIARYAAEGISEKR